MTTTAPVAPVFPSELAWERYQAAHAAAMNAWRAQAALAELGGIQDHYGSPFSVTSEAALKAERRALAAFKLARSEETHPLPADLSFPPKAAFEAWLAARESDDYVGLAQQGRDPLTLFLIETFRVDYASLSIESWPGSWRITFNDEPIYGELPEWAYRFLDNLDRARIAGFIPAARALAILQNLRDFDDE